MTSDYYSSGHGEDDSDHPLPLPQHKVLASATTTTTSSQGHIHGEQQRPASPLDPQTPELLLSPSPPQQQQLSDQHYDHHQEHHYHDHLEVEHTYSRAEREAATPTLEQMGLEKLDELDLRMLLQNAYEAIQEKDRGKTPRFYCSL